VLGQVQRLADHLFCGRHHKARDLVSHGLDGFQTLGLDFATRRLHQALGFFFSLLLGQLVGHSRVVPIQILASETQPNQRDDDSLPPYEVLDPILQGYVEEDRSFEELGAEGYDPEIVRRVIALVDGSEYKRRQGAPGIKITPRAFGRDRRMPITNRYLPDGLRMQAARVGTGGPEKR